MEELKQFIDNPTVEKYFAIVGGGEIDSLDYYSILRDVMKEKDFMTRYEPESYEEACAMFVYPSREARGDWNPEKTIQKYINNGALVDVAKKIIEFKK